MNREAIRRINRERINKAKEIQKTCGCIKSGKYRYKNKCYLCEHFNFAIIFPEFIDLEIWKDSRSPKEFTPTSNEKVLLACKLKCGSDAKEIELRKFIDTKGCSMCCGTKGKVLLSRTIGGNYEMMQKWSKSNKEDPSTILQYSKNKFLWICENGHEWSATASNIKKGSGCPECPKLYSAEVMIKNFREIHGDRYEYDMTNYNSMNSKIKISCKSHGIFEQTVRAHHKSKSNCPKCVHESYMVPWNLVTQRLRKIHGDRYEYKEETYRGTRNKMTIICKQHSEFNMRVDHHYRGLHCPKCSELEKDSKLVRFVKELLDNSEIGYESEKKFEDLRGKNGHKYLPFDIYVEKFNLIIELDGVQHFIHKPSWLTYEEFCASLMRDVLKEQYALSKNFNIIRIPYWAKEKDIIEVLEFGISNIKHKKQIYFSYNHYSH